MSTTDSTTINPKQLRELHLNSLQSLYNLSDDAVGAVELILAVELAHWDISYTAALMDLHNLIRSRRPSLNAQFSVGDEALGMIKALEAHNGTLAEKLADTQKELTALRANYANLSDNLLEVEGERDRLREELDGLKRIHATTTVNCATNETKYTEAQTALERVRAEFEMLRTDFGFKANSLANAEDRITSLQNELIVAHREIGRLQQALKETTARAETAEQSSAEKQAAIDAVVLGMITDIVEGAGTEAAANPPEPTPAPTTPPQTHTAALISRPYLPHGEALAALERQANANGNNSHTTAADLDEAEGEEPATTIFDWTQLPMVYQSLVRPLELKEIAWKSLSTEQKTKLAVEVAAQILEAQPDFPDTTLAHDLFNDSKPEWMTSLQGLAVGVPLPIQELRQLAVNRAHRRIAKIQEQRRANGPASQAANQDANRDSGSNSESSAPSSSN